MRLPLPLRPPTLTGASPSRSVRRAPWISTVASSLATAMTFTPWNSSPAPTALGGLAFTTSSALLPSTPASATACACAHAGASSNPMHRATVR